MSARVGEGQWKKYIGPLAPAHGYQRFIAEVY